jgi:hypothetical protein
MLAKRSLSIIGVLVALLLNSWSNVIAAAFCPRYSSNRDCCVKQLASKPEQVENQSCHHEMGDMAGMEMDDMKMETETSSDSNSDASAQISQAQITSESPGDQVALDFPIEQCPHCWSHSQPTSGSMSVVAGDPAKRLIETDEAPAALNSDWFSAFPILITPSEHGPPGLALPRHVLINVFRI